MSEHPRSDRDKWGDIISPSTLTLSVVLCTHDRIALICKAVDSVLGQFEPDLSTEIVVVLNRSSDEMVSKIKSRYAGITAVRIMREEKLGLSSARNKGLRSAQGRLIAFIDDDVIVGEGWLRGVLQSFEDGGTSTACVAGRVTPIWEVARPAWLHDDLLGYLSLIDWAPQPRKLAATEWLVGANMAFSRIILLRIGGFSDALGRKGSTLLSGEETLAFKTLQRRDYQCYYDPRMCVGHFIPSSRLKRGWFFRRGYWQGVSYAILGDLLDERPISTLGIISLLLGASVKAPLAFIVGRQDLLAVSIVKACWGLGFIRQSFFPKEY